MIDLTALAALAGTDPAALSHPVAPFRVGDRTVDTDAAPLLMGVVNLSGDSNYRASVAVDTESAIRLGRVEHAAGADFVDIGAESTNGTSVRVDPVDQIDRIVPVIRGLADLGVPTSIEGYDAKVLTAGLTAGASVINLTGSLEDDFVLDLAAQHGASVIMCHVLGDHARALDRTDLDGDPTQILLDHFGPRIERARELGVPAVSIDPGLGLGFRLSDPQARARLQAAMLLASFRLRPLGVPICHALPHALGLFGPHYGTAEGFFAVLAHLGRTGIYRTHEVGQVAAVLRSLRSLDVESE